MSQSIDFETPENVTLSYRVAGLGSRFVAWFVDSIFVAILMVVIGILLIIVSVAAETTIDVWLEDLLESSVEDDGANPQEQATRIMMIMMGIFLLIWGLGSFVYFFLTELFMRGQTPGKKVAKVRVVKADGFSLDAGSIFIRNIFRVVDQIPLLWIVPLVSPDSKRFGDMVGGTLVVDSGQQQINPLRTRLLERDRGDLKFRFSVSALENLTAGDLSAIEEFSQRMGKLDPDKRAELLNTMIPPLAEKLKLESPEPNEYEEFLLDLLTAEYRRQERRLG